MGLGLQGSGIAIAQFFSKYNAKVTVTDIKTKDKLQKAIDKLKGYKNIRFVLGQHRPEDFSQSDLVIKGPGISWNSKYLLLAKKNKVPIETEAGIFVELVENPIIGVTGTRGKSTTTSAIFKLLKEAKVAAILGGNIKNKPLIKTLEQVKNYKTYLVLELSSFQLEGFIEHKKSPHIAVITNLMADHLNRYKSIDDYHEVKKGIAKYQKNKDFTILNADDPKLRDFSSELKSQVWYFSLNRLGGENVVFLSDNKIYYRDHKKEEELIDTKNIKLIGKHRLTSVLVTVAVGKILKISDKIIKKAIQEFKGIQHRLEVIAEKEGVLYVNDSTSTVPEAAIMAVRSFKNVILIAGGADKKLDFKDLVLAINKNVKKLILLPGKGTDRILIALKKHLTKEELENLNYELTQNMHEAVQKAKDFAKPGDVVVLSPACSSFSQYNNEFDRGDDFAGEVEAL